MDPAAKKGELGTGNPLKWSSSLSEVYVKSKKGKPKEDAQKNMFFAERILEAALLKQGGAGVVGKEEEEEELVNDHFLTTPIVSKGVEASDGESDEEP